MIPTFILRGVPKLANIILRTLILFSGLLIMMRLLGKRQIGQLQPYEFALTLIAADLATTPMSDINTPLLWGIIPIYVLLASGLILSLVSLKSVKARHIICGKPKILIERGVILEEALRTVRYTINDLAEQLRSKDIFDISEVYYAILETNGEISVILKSQYRTCMPNDISVLPPQDELSVALIMDGTIQTANLDYVQKSEKWLRGKMRKLGMENEKDILLMTYDGSKLYVHASGKDPLIKEEQCGT